MSFISGDLVRVIKPESLKEMNVVGIITTPRFPSKAWFEVWIPDLGREISFQGYQLKKID